VIHSDGIEVSGYNIAMGTLYRQLPAVHQLLESPRLAGAVERHGHRTVVAACQRELSNLRARIRNGEIVDEVQIKALADALPDLIDSQLEAVWRRPYAEVLNGTGVLLHTNLGRAPMGKTVPAGLEGYLALEYDLKDGRRGQRLDPIRRRLAETFGAEAGVMVNNNAAAVLLMLTVHAAGREVIVSRGQLIEIGGSFRLPDIMAASGARMVEVGCTNRTHLHDYARAIGENTAAILVAHRSNFRMEGFTAEPQIRELADLAHENGLPLLVDQGSGAVHDLRRWSLPHEPTVGEILSHGADIVCFSGDKLLGGPQAGIAVGGAQWVEPMGRHSLFRALRPDKTALVHMERILAAHHEERLEEIPLYAMLGSSLEELRRRARRLARRLRAAGLDAETTPTKGALGGGTTPGATVPGHGLRLAGGNSLAAALRRVRPPVIAVRDGDRVVLDLRTIPPDRDRALESAILEAVAETAHASS